MSKKNTSYGARHIGPNVAQSNLVHKQLSLSPDVRSKYLSQSINQLHESYVELANRFVEIFNLAKSETEITRELFDEASRVAMEAFYVTSLLSKQGREMVPSGEHFRAFRKEHANDSLSALMDQCDRLQYDLKILGLQFAATHYPIKARLNALFAMWSNQTQTLELNCLITERRLGHEYRSRPM